MELHLESFIISLIKIGFKMLKNLKLFVQINLSVLNIYVCSHLVNFQGVS